MTRPRAAGARHRASPRSAIAGSASLAGGSHHRRRQEARGAGSFDDVRALAGGRRGCGRAPTARAGRRSMSRAASARRCSSWPRMHRTRRRRRRAVRRARRRRRRGGARRRRASWKLGPPDRARRRRRQALLRHQRGPAVAARSRDRRASAISGSATGGARSRSPTPTHALYAVTVVGQAVAHRFRQAREDDRRHGRLAGRHRSRGLTLELAGSTCGRAQKHTGEQLDLLGATDAEISRAAAARSSSRVPTDPGVYLMKDKQGPHHLRRQGGEPEARVRSVFQPIDATRATFVPLLGRHPRRHRDGRRQQREGGAAPREHLIKQHQPRFNVKLADDKNYLVLRLDPEGALSAPRGHAPHRQGRRELLRARITRRRRAARRCAVVNRHFKLRTCTDHVLNSRKRPCLQYQIKRCDAPCVYPDPRRGIRQAGAGRGAVPRGQGRRAARAAERAHEGRGRRRASTRSPARCAIRSRALEKTLEEQRVVSVDLRDQDVFGFYREGERGRDRRAVDPQRQAARAAQLLASAGRSFRRRRCSSSFVVALLRPRRLHPRRGAAAVDDRGRGAQGRVAVARSAARAQGRGAGAAARAARTSSSSWRRRTRPRRSSRAATSRATPRRRWTSCSSG